MQSTISMNVRMMSLPEGKLFHNPELEYKEVVQKLVVRQAYVKKGDDKRRQKHLVQELRQDLSEIRYEAQESFQAMHQDLRRTEQPSAAAVPIEEDVYASDTLKAMQKLIQPNKDEK
ncbi:uncharacterized protein LOC117102136 isoform X2 [Anneissia japonica]|uniref:uncharacterized protein LOC117102136 isoform X2 n=1 Tax=Anneissia japonica TaxID=1529436 RepID=UPI001425716A|nr:uncharacterized protein LOC117102136 isoform X2 [Anneissia japonica]